MVHINNTLKLLGFEDLDIKEFKIYKSEMEIHKHLKLRVNPYKYYKKSLIPIALYNYRKKYLDSKKIIS